MSDDLRTIRARVLDLVTFRPAYDGVDYDDAAALLAEIERLEGDNRLLRQKLAIAWADIVAAENRPDKGS